MMKMITPKDFSDSYSIKWIEEFHNVSSKSLRDSWSTLATAFNDCIIDNKDGRDARRLVVSMPTGSGKTTGLAHYLGMLPEDTKAVIIVFFTDSADELENTINQSNPGKAIAIHSKNGTKLTDISEHQVLIVTHAHYLNHMYKDHLEQRDLVVIDEAIDLLQEYRITNPGLRRLRTVFESVINPGYDVKDSIDKVIGMLETSKQIQEQINNINNDYKEAFKGSDDDSPPSLSRREHLLKSMGIAEGICFDDLREIIRKKDCSQILTTRSNSFGEASLKQVLLEDITSIENILKGWFYYYGSNLDTSSLNTASIKLPNKSVVVLDATATTNYLYKMFSDVTLYPSEEKARSYSNVDLYLAKGFSTGKSSLMTNPQTSAGSLLENLRLTIPNTSKVLIVTHKGLGGSLASYEMPFDYEVNHFGNLTGKNDWQDFDTVVIYGLMHKPEEFHINRQATSGKDDFINIDDNYARKKLISTDLASEVIQAINRVRCRKVIDEEGNCKKTNIYLTLPPGELGADILSSVRRVMVNINIKDWVFNSSFTGASPKRSSYIRPIILHVSARMGEGVASVSSADVRSSLGIPSSSYDDIVRTNGFIRALSEAGLKLELPPTARRGQYYYKIN